MLEERDFEPPELLSEVGAVASSLASLKSGVVRRSSLYDVRELSILGKGELASCEVAVLCIQGCRLQASSVLADLDGEVEECCDDSNAAEEVAEVAESFEQVLPAA